MFARFFVDRPVFAWVISIVIVLGGVVAALVLPIAQYPDITPPSVQVSAIYPGASARVVADTVAAPIEQQVNGVENMLYMSSNSTNDGSYNLTVTFELGTDLNMAQVLVQNRVNLATAQLPDEVQRQGLTIKKKSPNILLVVSLYSPDGTRNQLDLSNYATIQLKDELARIKGVGDITLLGQQDFSMRAWLDPVQLYAKKLTTTDVVNAIKGQNIQVAAGQIGQEPMPPGQSLQLTLSTLGRLVDAGQFEQIVVKSGEPGPNGQINPVVRLKDIARVELTAKNQDIRNTLDGQPAVGLAVFQLPGSNALDTADRVKKKMEQLSKRFPGGYAYAVRYDTTPFIRQSVVEVFNTLRDAIILVAIVVLFFLQDWRAMILPMIDVPVALTGTFAVMIVFGFSLNNLTLFGLVLAIGIVVDDAIVVLENIERWIARGHDARTATINAMDEITGPIVAITLVLCSVFLPSAFLPGITGQFFRQFALTIAAAMIISAINAMTMTPARAVAIFKGREHGNTDPHAGAEALPWWGWGALIGFLAMKAMELAIGTWRPTALAELPSWAWGLVEYLPFLAAGLAVGWFSGKWLNAMASHLFKGFNKLFDRIAAIYGRTIGGLLRVSVIVLVIYGGLLVLTFLGLTRTPTGFIPFQDKGYLLVNVQLADAASVQRTSEVMAQVDKMCRDTPGVGHTVGISGQSVLLQANGSNFGTVFVILDDFDKRIHDSKQNGFAILFDLQARLRREIRDATVSIFPPPPVDGLGSAGGFKFIVEDRGDLGFPALQEATDGLLKEARKQPGIGGAFSQFRSDIPQLYAEIDRTKCQQMGVNLSDVFNTLQTYLGGAYVNDFNRFGRTWQVNVQADAPFRQTPEYIRNLRVRNAKGEMVPLGAVATITNTTGPVFVQRYNMYPSAAVNGNLVPGTSSTDGIRIIDDVAVAKLPKQMATEWTELFYLQTLEGSAAIWAFAGAVALVFLVLAAKYESWSLPLAIILVVPMCLLSSIAGIRLVKLDINIFVQVGFVVLVGLAAKNAILIVEFAQQLRSGGKSLRDSVVEASELRLRPIIMTSFAFILGVVPLVLAEGAGAEMRATLGVAVFSGMLGVTFFGVILTPIFAYLIGRFTQVKAVAPVTSH
ncbi:MAG TPA: efflux RND transporter permease subunit [Gemmata sp.]|nr:efflux RND transporter permease subunit [Gemmata sp.]